MPSVDFLVTSEIKRTTRVVQLEGMFDVPAKQKLTHSWKGDVPIEDKPWSIGLIVGPSGAGKSSIARQLFGEQSPLKWKASSIIDDFDSKLSIQTITEACSAVGFNTIPAWMKPFGVLSTGEKFRAELARHLLTDADPIVIDEFTSVVDRQVAHIGCNAVQKWVRKNNRKFVAVTCHYDVIEWLQPDWILEPATMTFRWRSVQRRPEINIEIARVNYEAWKLFAPFHYMSADLHRAAACYVLFANDEPAAFAATRHQPHAIVQNMTAISRLVTLPDFQGLGLIFVLIDVLGGAWKAQGYRFRNYPSHMSFVRASDRSPNWALVKKPGVFSPVLGRTSTLGGKGKAYSGGFNAKRWNMGGRPCAVFEYVGPARPEAVGLLEDRALLSMNEKRGRTSVRPLQTTV